MSTLDREAHRKASAELITALGHDPKAVLDSHGDGTLEWHGEAVVLEIIERDDAGGIKHIGGEPITRTERVETTPAQRAAYQVARWRES